MRRMSGLLALLLLGSGAIYTLSGPRTVATPQPPASSRVPVEAATVAVKPMPLEVSTIGRAEALASVGIRSRIDGQIDAVLVEEGREVKAGDVLFRLDDRQLQAAQRQAAANLARAQAQLANARRTVDRLTPLVQKDIAPRQQLDQAQTDVSTAQASIGAEEAALEAARVNLTYAVIKAPIDGRIGAIAAKPGSTVKGNDTGALLTINQIHPIYVTFAVPQREFAGLAVAMTAGPVRVLAGIPGDAGVPAEGEVAFFDNSIDPVTNTLMVKARFANADARLWPGLFVDTRLVLRVDQAALVVPAAAVQAGQAGTFLFVVKPDSTVEARPVEVARTIGEEAVISAGIAAGETVVTRGQLRLGNGVAVDVTGRPPRPASGRMAS